MPQGWIEPAALGASGGGTACLTIGCPDDFFAVRLAFANVTNEPWQVSKVIGRAASEFGNFIEPKGPSPWVTFEPDNEACHPATSFNPSAILVKPSKQIHFDRLDPELTWTKWALISSLAPDPTTSLRVLHLRCLVPSTQTVCYAVSQMRSLLNNQKIHYGFECFVGGLKFDIDRVNNTEGRESTLNWIDNQLVVGSLFPIIQFLTKNSGHTGLLIGDSHQQGTSTIEQMANLLFRATTKLVPEFVGQVPLGFVNAAEGGLTSIEFFGRLHAWVKSIKPSYVVLPGWTYNDKSGDTHADLAAMQKFFGRLLEAVETCLENGAIPIIMTPFPRDSKRMGPAQLAGWQWLRKQILSLKTSPLCILDASDILSERKDGALTGTYLPQYSADDAHPSDEGHEALAIPLAKIIRSICGLDMTDARNHQT